MADEKNEKNLSTPPASVTQDSLGPQLIELKTKVETLQGEKEELVKKLELSAAATLAEKEEVARLQGLLTQLSKSQLPDLGEGAYELGEGATIMASLTIDGDYGRVHAVVGDVLVVGLKPAQFTKLAAKLKGKARVFAVSAEMLAELRDLQLLRT